MLRMELPGPFPNKPSPFEILPAGFRLSRPQPTARARRVTLAPSLLGTREALEDGLNSDRAAVGRGGNPLPANALRSDRQSESPLGRGSLGISDSFAHLPAPPSLDDSPGRSPPKEHGRATEYSRSAKTIIVERRGTPESGA